MEDRSIELDDTISPSTITYPYDRIGGCTTPLTCVPLAQWPCYPYTRPAHSRRAHSHAWPRSTPAASVVYMDTHVLVLIDTDQIPKILRQPECMCPPTEAPVARRLFLRNIPGFRAFDATPIVAALNMNVDQVFFHLEFGKNRRNDWESD